MLSGGNFWEGATIGLIVSGLNHYEHQGDGDDPINDKYSGKVKAGPGTPRLNADGSVNSEAYNCHSFAFCDSLGDPYGLANAQSMADGYPFWDSDPYNNITACYSPLDFDAPNIVGDRITYFNYDSKTKTVIASHSGIVTKVDGNGRAIEITSKFGWSAKWIHHPRDIPSSYGSPLPTTTTPQGTIYNTRIYYRQNP